jgi:ureidoacrylate peracid hydrolase
MNQASGTQLPNHIKWEEKQVNASMVMTSLEQKVDPAHAALIVVDVQNDFCADEGFLGTEGFDMRHIKAAVPRIANIIDHARAGGVKVVFIRSIYDPHHLNDPMRERNVRRGLTVSRCTTGAWGAEFFGVSPIGAEPVITKHRYSAFQGTDLHIILRSWGIRTLIMTGVTTNVCVESTAREGYFLDHYIVLVEDCCGTTNEDRKDLTSEEIHRWTLTNIELTFGVVVSSADVIAAWQKQTAIPTVRAVAGSR